jgi:hypothetical protein
MRIILAAGAILGLSITASFADEPRAYDVRLLPHDEAGLSALDDKQLAIVRRTTSRCDATEGALSRMRSNQRPCVISGVDHAVEATDDQALEAYHNALPFNVRYDRYRSRYYYQQILLRVRN